MRVEETYRTQVVVLPSPLPKSPEDSRNRDERTLVIKPPTVYVEYDKNGHATEYRFGGQSWVC